MNGDGLLFWQLQRQQQTAGGACDNSVTKSCFVCCKLSLNLLNLPAIKWEEGKGEGVAWLTLAVNLFGLLVCGELTAWSMVWPLYCSQCFCSVHFVAADWNLWLFLRKLASLWVDSVNLNSHQRTSYTDFVKIRMHLRLISIFFMQISLAYHMTQRLRIHIRKVSGHRCSFVLDLNAFFKKII